MGHTDDDFFFGNADDVFVSNCFNYSVYDDDFAAFDLSNDNCTDYLGDYFDDDDFWDTFNYDDFIYWDDDYSDDYSDKFFNYLDCISSSTTNYVRCLAPFHPNAMYGLLAVYGVATVLLVVVVLGLLIPLFVQLKNGTFYQERNSRRSDREPPYSTYNLYLVYSALADLFYVLMEIISYAMDAKIAEYFHWYMPEANLFINAVIVYEVLALLRASQNGRRISQPSLTKVNLQAGAIFVGMILYAVLEWRFQDFFDRYYFLTLFVYAIPIAFVIGVTIYVKWKAYLPPSNGTTPRDKAVRGLAIFFFRVVLIVFYIWIPYLILRRLYTFSTYFDSALKLSYLFLAALQPIVNFCLILSKPDVKKYITDLVTLTYIFGDSGCCSCNRILFNKKKDTLPGDSANQGHGRQRNNRTSTTILGYTFSGVDDDDDDDAHNIESDSGVEEIADDNNSPMIEEDDSDGNNHQDAAETGTTNVSYK